MFSSFGFNTFDNSPSSPVNTTIGKLLTFRILAIVISSLGCGMISSASGQDIFNILQLEQPGCPIIIFLISYSLFNPLETLFYQFVFDFRQRDIIITAICAFSHLEHPRFSIVLYVCCRHRSSPLVPVLVVLVRFQFFFSQSQSNSGQVLCR